MDSLSLEAHDNHPARAGNRLQDTRELDLASSDTGKESIVARPEGVSRSNLEGRSVMAPAQPDSQKETTGSGAHHHQSQSAFKQTMPNKLQRRDSDLLPGTSLSSQAVSQKQACIPPQPIHPTQSGHKNCCHPRTQPDKVHSHYHANAHHCSPCPRDNRSSLSTPTESPSQQYGPIGFSLHLAAVAINTPFKVTSMSSRALTRQIDKKKEAKRQREKEKIALEGPQGVNTEGRANEPSMNKFGNIERTDRERKENEGTGSTRPDDTSRNEKMHFHHCCCCDQANKVENDEAAPEQSENSGSGWGRWVRMGLVGF